MAQSNVLPPEELQHDGDLAENWALFKQKFEIYVKAGKLEQESEAVRGYKLLNRVGTRGLKIYNTFKFAEGEDKTSYTVIVQKFEEKFVPTKNETYERHLFFTRSKKSHETFDEYCTELRQKADTCNFGDLTDSLIRDKLILGIMEIPIKDRLLREPNFTLEKAMEICRVAETTATQIKNLHEQDKEVNLVARNKAPIMGRRYRWQDSQGESKMGWERQREYVSQGNQTGSRSMERYEGRNATNNWETARDELSNNYVTSCNKCGNKHGPNKCPAYGKQCSQCRKFNHFRKVCWKNVDLLEYHNGEIRDGQVDEGDDLETCYIGNVDKKETDRDNTERWSELCILNNKIKIEFRLDTGADCNILPRGQLKN